MLPAPVDPAYDPQTSVITIDGPSASGKGAVAALVASAFGWHYLDSGALYRLAALAALRQQVAWDDASALVRLVRTLSIAFVEGRTLLDDTEVTAEIRREVIGEGASQIAALPLVRQALLQLQRDFVAPPGLVADGRDMGLVVFPQAQCKIFLTASPEVRAERRYRQLAAQGVAVQRDQVFADIIRRDARDCNREVAPLRAAPGAHLLDTSALTIAEAVERILDWCGLPRVAKHSTRSH